MKNVSIWHVVMQWRCPFRLFSLLICAGFRYVPVCRPDVPGVCGAAGGVVAVWLGCVVATWCGAMWCEFLVMSWHFAQPVEPQPVCLALVMAVQNGPFWLAVWAVLWFNTCRFAKWVRFRCVSTWRKPSCASCLVGRWRVKFGRADG